MHRPLVVLLALTLCHHRAEPAPRPLSKREAVYWELVRTLPTDGPRARAVRLELDYWLRQKAFATHSRRAVITKDGKSAEVVCLEVPGNCGAGMDFSLALLVVGDRVVDWTSCWTHDWVVSQKRLLEDIDGDGATDLAWQAIQAIKGRWEESDPRCQRLPGGDREWLYAFAIHSGGFRGLFPSKDKVCAVKLKLDVEGEPGKVTVKGIPGSARQYQLFACEVELTNTSMKDLEIVPGEWFRFGIRPSGHVIRGPTDRRTILKPGQTLSQSFTILVGTCEGAATLSFDLHRLETVP